LKSTLYKKLPKMKLFEYIRHIPLTSALLFIFTVSLHAQCQVNGSNPSDIRFYGSAGESTDITINLGNWLSGCELEFSYDESYLSVELSSLNQVSVALISDVTDVVYTSITISVFGDERIQIPVLISPSLQGGSIGSSVISVEYNTSPGTFSSSAGASGEDGSYSYQWQKSTDGGSIWTDIQGAIFETYTCPALVDNTSFVRKVTSNSLTAYSNTISISINLHKAINSTESENYILTYSPQESMTNEILMSLQELEKLSPTVQYFDGLGRPKQVVSVVASPNEMDIIQPIVYDAFGREQYRFLPYALDDKDNRGSFQTNPSEPGTTSDYSSSNQAMFYSNTDNSANGLAQDPYPYSKNVFENSPLNRIIEQGAPGAPWQPNTSGISNSGHTIKYEYDTNGDSEVRLFTVEDDELQNDGYYSPTELYKTVVKDENWTDNQPYKALHTTEEFKDKLGQVVLKRTYVEDGSDEDDLPDVMDTYYVYDDYGLLQCVIPPEAVKQMYSTTNITPNNFKLISSHTGLSKVEEGIKNYLISTGGSLTIKPGYIYTATDANSLTITTGNVSADLVYYYKYDDRKRMIEKKLPGASPVFMIYDLRDRLVATQDGNMRDTNKDGDYSDAKWLFTKYDQLNRPIATGIISYSGSQDELQTLVNEFSNENLYEERGTALHGYTNRSFPTTAGANDYLTITYYDSYDLPWTTRFSDITGISDYETTNSNYFAGVKGQTTATKTQILDANAFTASSQWLTSEVYYDDRYQVIKTVGDLYPANPSSNGKATNYEVISTKYDFTGKVISTSDYQSFSGNSNTVVVTNSYDHAGRLTKVTHKVNSNDPVTVAMMSYNELGQLMKKDLNPVMGSDGTVTDEVQEMNYRYNIRGWLKQINDPDESLSDDSKKKFAMRLNYESVPANLAAAAQFNGNISAIEWRSMVNTDIAVPDAKQAFGYNYDAVNRLTAANYASGSTLSTSIGDFNETIGNYDLNGNIGTVTRKKSGTLIDDMVYTYSGNQLISVNDSKDDNVGFIEKSQSGTEYSYDANGNMTEDLNKGLANISYNLLNLPDTITGSDNKTISYIYSTNGQKLAKKSTDGSMTYYAGSFIYKGTSLDYIVHPEGLYIASGSTVGYQYNLKDHLGNIRMVVNTSNTIVDQSDYYSFGMLMTKKFNGGISNSYKYNGKELQEDSFNGNDLDWYDYGARFYDPQLGRFSGLDPIASNYASVTPYNYAENRPIDCIDLWGLQAYQVSVGGRGALPLFAGVGISGSFELGMILDHNMDLIMYNSFSLGASFGEAISIGLNFAWYPSANSYNDLLGVGLVAGASFSLLNQGVSIQGNLSFVKNESDKLGVSGGWGCPGLNDGIAAYADVTFSNRIEDFGAINIYNVSESAINQISLKMGISKQKVKILLAMMKTKMEDEELKKYAKETNLLKEVVVTDESSNSTTKRMLEDLMWIGVRPNSYGNTGRYNKPGKECDQYYDDEFLKWYYNDPKKDK
jgi:RHS repeat-associated protein